jgi:hypothetical protein
MPFCHFFAEKIDLLTTFLLVQAMATIVLNAGSNHILEYDFL